MTFCGKFKKKFKYTESTSKGLSQFVKNYMMTFLDSLINGKTGPGCKTNVPWEELTFHPRGVGSQTEALDLGSDGLLSPLVDPQQTPGPTPNLSRATPDSEPGTQLMLTHQELSGRPAWGMCVSAGPRPPSTTAWGHTWLPGCPGACKCYPSPGAMGTPPTGSPVGCLAGWTAQHFLLTAEKKRIRN